MASVQAVDKIRSTKAIKLYDFDPDATTVTSIAWVDMKDFTRFLATFFRTIGTSAVTFDIAASAAAAGTNPVVVKTHAVASQPDALADQIHLEIQAEEIAILGTHLRYVSARVSVATGTDEGVVLYLREGGYDKRDLTADIIA